MSTNFHNRQTRRAGLCISAHTPRGFEPAIAPGPTADGDGLAQVAERIAEELDLSPEAIDELLFGQAPAPATGGSAREA